METTVVQSADTTVDLALNIRLHEQDYSRVMATKQDLSLVAGYLIEQYAKGGVLLRPAQVSYIEQLTGNPCKTSEAILQAFENMGQRGTTSGFLRVTYDVDPAFATPLEDLARAQGRSVDDIVQESLAIVLTNSWLYSLNIEGGTLYFTKESREEMEQLVGKPLTTTMILECIKKLKDNQKKPSIKEQVRKKLDEVEA